MLSMASGSCLELLGEFTVAESRENDSLGNPQKILDDYVANVMVDYDRSTVFLLVAENNAASNYILQKMIWIGNDTSVIGNAGSVLRRQSGEYIIRNLAVSTSAWCSIGTVLKLYRVKGA